MATEDPVDLRKLVYPETYFVGMSPPELRLALLSRGVKLEANRPLRYLELGFGSGFSMNIHAAANDGEFWGNDFVPAHVDGASAIASMSGASARFVPDSFAELLGREDLPEFDIIAAHGIWTWVPDEDRAAIVTLLERKLAPGGAFYVSYNNTAGWSSVVYLRQLMKLYLAESDDTKRAEIAESVAFARSLQGAGAAYFKENPTAGTELAGMDVRDPVYLRQEYFLDDWKLMSLAEVESALAPAGLRFGAQFPLIMHDDELVLGQSGQAILANVKSPILRETVREAFQGMGFRQDIFTKKATSMSAEERRDHFRRQSFLLTTQPRNVMLKGPSPWGELDLGARGCVPVMNALAELGAAPHALAAIETALPAISIDDLITRIILLAAVDIVRPTLSAEEQQIAAPRCAALNAYILGLPGEGGAVLASPVLGAGVRVSPVEKAFIAACADGAHGVDDIAAALAASPEARGRDPRQLAASMLEEHLPIYRAMGLIGS